MSPHEAPWTRLSVDGTPADGSRASCYALDAGARGILPRGPFDLEQRLVRVRALRALEDVVGDLWQDVGWLARLRPRGVSGSQDEVDVFREQLEELGADDLVFPGVENGTEQLQELRVIHGRDPFPKTSSASATVTPRATRAARSFRRAS